jgi:hypothetical protein
MVHTVVARSHILILTVLYMVSASPVDAQQLEPRTYTNTPVGMNFLIAGYGYATGSVVSDPSLPLENADIDNHELVLGYARSLDMWGMSGKVDMILPYAWSSGSAEFAGEFRERRVDGFGDPRLRLSVNFFGAPALSLKDFLTYKQDLLVGASLQVGLPMGQYDADRLLNIGTNRWTFRPELGISKAFGPLTLEVAAGVFLYTDNTDFLGGNTRKQDPLYEFQAHLIYNMPSGIWLAVDGTYYTGGTTTIAGVSEGERQDNSRIGLTAAFPIDRHQSLKIFAATGVYARAAGDFDSVGVAWQYRWGGGL